MKRLMTESEKILIIQLLVKSEGVNWSDAWLNSVMVEPMNDGGMGGIRFLSSSERKMSRMATEMSFKDADGVTAVVSLNVDKFNEPYEMDIWKVDFSPLTKIPDNFRD